MPDMYDKLGELLNEALESGKIPHENQNDQVTSDEKIEEPGHFNLKSDEINENNGFDTPSGLLNHRCFKKKKQISTGEVIKLHKYTYNMQFPPQIQIALTTLDIAYSFTIKDITTAYHKKLKEIHPDTKNTIQTSKDVQNIRQYTVDEIKESYKILCNFFDVK